jgi:hypothetical protein
MNLKTATALVLATWLTAPISEVMAIVIPDTEPPGTMDYKFSPGSSVTINGATELIGGFLATTRRPGSSG